MSVTVGTSVITHRRETPYSRQAGSRQFGQTLKPALREVDAVCMAEEPRDTSQVALHSAYQEYRQAMASWRAASKVESTAAAELAAERLLRARVALYRGLVATGWQPPPAVTAQLERDAALLEAPEDFDAMLRI